MPAAAKTPTPPTNFTQAKTPDSHTIDFVSTVNGHRYRLNIALPDQPPPAQGYRVFYVLDGSAYFGTATEAVRGSGYGADVVVAAIGYPDTAEFIAEVKERRGAGYAPTRPMPELVRARIGERMWDLTLPLTSQALTAQSMPMAPDVTAANVGGVDDFLSMIDRDVKPRVGSLVPVAGGQDVLFGYSLGGLATLRALFTRPGSYRTFIVASPSIWWGDRAVLRDEAAFFEAVRDGRARGRVLLTMGGDESSPPAMPVAGISIDALSARTARFRMVGNVRELVARLRHLSEDSPRLEAQYAEFPHQRHGISAWPAFGRAVTFAFAPEERPAAMPSQRE